jgi:predicted SAM-dependent methyltransferase
VRLNLGSGGQPLDDYTNVDLHAPADIQGDIRDLEFADIEEVVLYHLLEHIPHAQTVPVLKRIHGWMRPDARIVVEVPDMQGIFECPSGSWLTDVYGVQSHEGEFHYAGFMKNTLSHALHEAGFQEIKVTQFFSRNPNRPGMPCLEATAVA